jgi:hypothetical protein
MRPLPTALGRSLALTHRPIVFGGGTSGLMSALVKGFVEIGEDGRVQGEKEVGLNKGEGNRTDGEGEGDKVGKADGKKGTGEKKGKMEMKIVEGLHEVSLGRISPLCVHLGRPCCPRFGQRLTRKNADFYLIRGKRSCLAWRPADSSLFPEALVRPSILIHPNTSSRLTMSLF